MSLNPQVRRFLAAAMGPAAPALIKAASSPDIAWALVPRALMGFLDVMGQALTFDAHLPGCPDVLLQLQKSRGGYSGCVEGPLGAYPFVNQNLEHVAGALAVQLELEVGHPDFQHPSVPRLAKAVQLLAKQGAVRALASAAARRPSSPPDAKAPHGPAAAPRTPEQPTGAVASQPTNRGQLPGAADAPAQKPKGKRSPTMQITKAESLTPCSTCGASQFRKDRFTGCRCSSQELVKSCKVLSRAGGYQLEFGPGWDVDAIMTLADQLGK